MCDHGSIGIFLRNSVFGGEFGSECFGLFPFLFFLFSAGQKIRRRTRFWLVIKGRWPLPVMVSFLFLFACDNFELFTNYLVQRPFYIFLLFCFDLWSWIFIFFFGFFQSLMGIFFFCFLLIFDLELYFSFVFFQSLIRNFFSFFFVFFRGRGWTFSPWVKVYGELGFWLKACRTAGHDICQGVGLASGSGIKECPTLFPWHACNNDDSEILCKTGHACTYVDTQALSFVVMWH